MMQYTTETVWCRAEAVRIPAQEDEVEVAEQVSRAL